MRRNHLYRGPTLAQPKAEFSDIEVAIILGAGASMPPLVGQQGLVKELLSAKPQARIQAAQKYLKTIFPGAPNKTLRFEDIVGPLEIAEAEEYWFHFAGRLSPKTETVITNQAVLDALDTWVAMCLDPETLPKPQKGTKTNSGTMASEYFDYYRPSQQSRLSYARLIQVLLGLRLLERTAFVSMNYDILLDRVFYASTTHQPDYVVDGFFEEPKAEDLRKVVLLKLHGSLNWRSCDRCHILRNERPFVVWPGSHCVDCDSKQARPMLIRPTLLKDFRHRVWQEVWRAAGHVLAAAKLWIFIGYSLPLADVWMLRLLAQSFRSGGIVPRTREITVVNTDAAVKDRFSVLFPDLMFKHQTFDEWISSGEAEQALK